MSSERRSAVRRESVAVLDERGRFVVQDHVHASQSRHRHILLLPVDVTGVRALVAYLEQEGTRAACRS